MYVCLRIIFANYVIGTSLALGSCAPNLFRCSPNHLSVVLLLRRPIFHSVPCCVFMAAAPEYVLAIGAMRILYRPAVACLFLCIIPGVERKFTVPTNRRYTHSFADSVMCVDKVFWRALGTSELDCGQEEES